MRKGFAELYRLLERIRSFLVLTEARAINADTTFNANRFALPSNSYDFDSSRGKLVLPTHCPIRIVLKGNCAQS